MGTDGAVGGFGRLWLHIFVGLVLFFLASPIVILICGSFTATSYIEFPPTSFSLRWYQQYLATAEWRSATLVSFQAAILSAALATTLGTFASYSIHRMKGAAAKFVQGCLIAPMIVPVITLAIGIFYLFAYLDLVNTLTGLVLAHAVTAIPLVVVTVGAAFKQFDPNLENAARSLGASWPFAFATVTLPGVKGGVIAAALLALVHSLDEVVIALFITAGDTATLPRRFFSMLRDYVDPTIAAVSCLLILVSALCMLLSEVFRSNTQTH
ncbi:ABC transporter permease [Bradyrhizobium liaoningense]